MKEITSEALSEATPLATIPAGQRSNGNADWFPPVDILEDAQEYLFKIDLPEVLPEDMRVFVEQDELVISGERPMVSAPYKQCLRLERPHGHFERRFTLPDNASRVEIEPLFKECVLELHIRKICNGIESPAQATSPSKLRLRSGSWPYDSEGLGVPAATDFLQSKQ